MGRRKVYCALAGFVLAPLCYGLYAAVAPSLRPVLGAEAFELRLAADKEVYALGERPKFSLTLSNKSGGDQTLVLPLDGSTRGRYPSLQWSITAPPDALPEEQLGYCGNTNPLRAEDFVVVPKDGAVDLLAGGGPEYTELDRGPGEYTLSAAFSTDQPKVGYWLGGPLAPAQEKMLALKLGPKLAKVPRFSVTSNTVKIRYEASPESLADMIQSGSANSSILALRTVEQSDGAEPAVIASVLTVLQRLGDFSTWQDQAFAAKAVPLLAKMGTAADIEALWTMAFPSVPREELRHPGTESAMSAGLVQAVLRMPQPQREERLLFLFTAQEGRGRLLLPGPVAVQLFQTDPGSDIDRCLEAMVTQSDYPDEAALYREILAKRGRPSGSSVSS